jgi:Kyakuja-Dileera-Zisupton transposase
MDVLDDQLLFGSDIVCSLQKTVAASLLGERFKAKQCRCCLNVMHGYTHNWACQKANHPNLIKCLSLKDLETLEHIFSTSNAVTGITCYATPYRRLVFIDMFFRQWDEEKYLNLGTMLYNNYVQALDIIDMESIALQHSLQSLGASEADLDKLEVEEAEYFQTLGQEPEWDVHAIAYIKLLQELCTMQ